MSESERSVGTIGYDEGSLQVTLSGLAVLGVKLLGLYLLVQGAAAVAYLPLLLWERREGA